jgi:hypothetical protein
LQSSLGGFENKFAAGNISSRGAKCVFDSCVFSVAQRVETGGWLTYSSGGRLGSSNLDGVPFREGQPHGTRGGPWLARLTGGCPWPIEAVASLAPAVKSAGLWRLASGRHTAGGRAVGEP